MLHHSFFSQRSSGCWAFSSSQNIRVKKNLHDTWEKTSSSVKNPRASAKGIILFRISSNCSSRNCRRRASRAISLRFLPDRLLALDNKASRSLSNRIVKVAVFMYCKVRYRFLFVKACSLFPYLCSSQAHNHYDGVFNAEPQKRAHPKIANFLTFAAKHCRQAEHSPLLVGAKRRSRSSGAAGSFIRASFLHHSGHRATSY
jgi:hypothetical protein